MSYSSRQFAKQWINHYSRKDTNHHIKGSDTAANRRTLVIVPFSCVIDDRLGDGRLDTFTTLVDTELDLNTTANWDTVTPTDYTVPATRAGKDFYIYACIQSGNVPKILLSANSTYPSGYTANNSREIGGFHCIPSDIVVAYNHQFTGFIAGDIHKTSIWDLLFRPKYPEGTYYDKNLGAWPDLYPASGDGTVPTSVFGATITFPTWVAAVDYGKPWNKRLMTDAEFQIAAAGSPEQTSLLSAVTPTVVASFVDTNGVTVLSSEGGYGYTGTIWQWLDEHAYQPFVPQQPSMSMSTRSCTYMGVTKAASPTGNPVYLKLLSANHGYLCSNLAVLGASMPISCGYRSDNFNYLFTHDADAATGGLQVYFDATNSVLLVNNTIFSGDIYIPTVHPNFWIKIKHDASAATHGTALYANDTDLRLESAITPASGTIYTYNPVPPVGYYNIGANRGANYMAAGIKVSYAASTVSETGEIKMCGGGRAPLASLAGSLARDMYDKTKEYSSSSYAARFIQDPMVIA